VKQALGEAAFALVLVAWGIVASTAIVVALAWVVGVCARD
jgi:hypothetical protein